MATTNIDLSGSNLSTLDANHNGTVTKAEFYAATTNSTLRSFFDAGLLKFTFNPPNKSSASR